VPGTTLRPHQVRVRPAVAARSGTGREAQNPPYLRQHSATTPGGSAGTEAHGSRGFSQSPYKRGGKPAPCTAEEWDPSGLGTPR
jgi:hypothetical protein